VPGEAQASPGKTATRAGSARSSSRRARAAAKTSEAAVFCAADAPDEVSRAVTAKAADIEQVILTNWDQQARLSRAGLRRDLQVLLNLSEEN